MVAKLDQDARNHATLSSMVEHNAQQESHHVRATHCAGHLVRQSPEETSMLGIVPAGQCGFLAGGLWEEPSGCAWESTVIPSLD